MDTPIGAHEPVGINTSMTPIFKTSINVNGIKLMTPTFNAGKPVDLKNLKKLAFGRRASIGAAHPFKKKAEERYGLSVFKRKKHNFTNNLMTPVFGCRVPVRAAQVN